MQNDVVLKLLSYPSGVTVADLCADFALPIQSVSTLMTQLERKGEAHWCGRRTSVSTGAKGKVWFAGQGRAHD